MCKVMIDALQLAKKIRISALKMTSKGGSSHIGSILSIADILAVLYGHVLRINPANPAWELRDKFVLSKGHAGAGVYAALSHTGFFDTELLETHYQNGSLLSGHVSHKGIPGVEFSTGSLGHGLAVAVGMSLDEKLRGGRNKVYCLLSDGECDEGSNWEAVLIAAHHKLDNLIVIVDYNKLQSVGTNSETLNLEPFTDKWRAFNWDVLECDGHSLSELSDVLTANRNSAPLCVIAHTVKGKGVSFMENQVLWHYRTAKGEEFENAIKELSM
jgi:transketolase